ncbi:hypothetical protein PTKIN_Ptkin06aG0188700 [Pterospermum kingtungense]
MAALGGKRLENNRDFWPEDLILPILTTLPAKSLLRLKCVSKHWLSLITDPDFIEHHLQNQHKKYYPQLIVASTAPEIGIVLESVSIVDVEFEEKGGLGVSKVSLFTTLQPERLSISSLERRDPSFIVPTLPIYLIRLSCESNLTKQIGSALVREEFVNLFGIYAICCGESVRDQIHGQELSGDHIVGFGRDQVTKECKIVRLFRPKEQENDNVHECEVFTLSSNTGASWIGIGEIPYFIRANQQPAYVNGALHWIVDQRHANPSEVIISFDLHTEKFQAISRPSCCSTSSDRNFIDLASLRSCLCLADTTEFLQWKVWIMNQSNGILEKLFYINWPLMNGNRLASPVAEFKDGTFVICHRRNLKIYYPKSKSSSEALLEYERFLVPFAYSESLVPLYGESLINSSPLVIYY